MVTLQEYLDNIICPTKKEKEKLSRVDMEEFSRNPIYPINKGSGSIGNGLDGSELDLSEYPNLESIYINNRFNSPLTKLKLGNHPKLTDTRVIGNEITSFDASSCPALTKLWVADNRLVSVNFLNQIPNPERLGELVVSGNNIQPTNIEVFSRFVNLKFLHIGTGYDGLKKGKYSKFYGSFESWKNLTKLDDVCIEATDIDSGLEYLAPHLEIRKFHCSPNDTNAKCEVIKDQLRGFSYDIRSWQLAHPILMKKVNEEIFSDLDKYKIEVEEKIKITEQDLERVRISESDKIKKIERLESKLKELQKVKETLEKSTQTDLLTTADKETQTDLTAEDIKKALEIQRQIQSLAKK